MWFNKMLSEWQRREHEVAEAIMNVMKWTRVFGEYHHEHVSEKIIKPWRKWRIWQRPMISKAQVNLIYAEGYAHH